MRILIPQAMQRNVLAAVRALGRAGHEITMAVPVRKKDADTRFFSRYVSHTTTVRSPFISAEAFVEDLLGVLKRGQYDVLLPFTHDIVVPVSYYKAELSPYAAIPFPDYAVLRRAHDKLETVRVAHSVGVKTPVTFWPRSREELEELRPHIPFPCLVKARQGCGIGTTIRYATDFDELLAGYDAIDSQPSSPPVNEYDHPIIQEYVPGDIHDGLFLYANGQCRAAVSQDRVVTYPIHGGTGAVNRTTDDPELLDIGRRLLDAIGWHGPTQVEVMRDARDGQYKLLEINPKFWGTLACSMAAGVNFPEMAVQLAAQGDVPAQFDYRKGVTYHWRFPDVLYTVVQDPTWKRFSSMFEKAPDLHYDWDWSDVAPDAFRMYRALRTVFFSRKSILPARNELNTLAMKNPPAVQQPEWLG